MGVSRRRLCGRRCFLSTSHKEGNHWCQEHWRRIQAAGESPSAAPSGGRAPHTETDGRPPQPDTIDDIPITVMRDDSGAPVGLIVGRVPAGRRERKPSPPRRIPRRTFLGHAITRAALRQHLLDRLRDHFQTEEQLETATQRIWAQLDEAPEVLLV